MRWVFFELKKENSSGVSFLINFCLFAHVTPRLPFVGLMAEKRKLCSSDDSFSSSTLVIKLRSSREMIETCSEYECDLCGKSNDLAPNCYCYHCGKRFNGENISSKKIGVEEAEDDDDLDQPSGEEARFCEDCLKKCFCISCNVYRKKAEGQFNDSGYTCFRCSKIAEEGVEEMMRTMKADNDGKLDVNKLREALDDPGITKVRKNAIRDMLLYLRDGPDQHDSSSDDDGVATPTFNTLPTMETPPVDGLEYFTDAGGKIYSISANNDTLGFMRDQPLYKENEEYMKLYRAFHDRVTRCKSMDGKQTLEYYKRCISFRRSSRSLSVKTTTSSGACAHTKYYRVAKDRYFYEQVFAPIDDKDKNVAVVYSSPIFTARDDSEIRSVDTKESCIQCKYVGTLYMCQTCPRNHLTREILRPGGFPQCKGNVEKDEIVVETRTTLNAQANKVRVCSQCFKPGHNKQTCPELKKQK